MSIHQNGLNDKIQGAIIAVKIENDHPLILLGNILPWSEFFDIILPDLKSSTEKGKWWCGRALKVRIHLGAYILQQLFNKKDRQIEAEIKDNAAYQIFCGRDIVKVWHCPDRTKIEAFRSRLSPQTQQALANKIAQVAVNLGFASARDMDIDSTVQEANCSYPRDVRLMVRLGMIAHKVGHYLNDKFFKADFWDVDLKAIKSAALKCFYKADCALIDLWRLASQEVTRIKRACDLIGADMPKLPWFIKRSLSQIQEYGSCYFSQVIPWIARKKVAKDKALCFHLKDITCFKKKGKAIQFGRSHQLGRLTGNFMIIGNSDRVRMKDHPSLSGMLDLHQDLFGQDVLTSFAADRGYASQDNRNILIDRGVKDIGLQIKSSKQSHPPPNRDQQIKLQNRRAGIEPLIGHLKRGWQMGKTRLKTDRTGLSSAYASVLGFNLRQLMRKQEAIV